MDNREMFRSDEFSKAWHVHQQSKKDLLRTKILNPILEKKIGNLSSKIVLDAGCGDGFFIPNLLAKNPKKIYACDISPFLVKTVKEEQPEVDCQVVDLLEKWPYSSETFDTILLYNVIMDLPTIQNAIGEVARTLKKGGTAHITIVHPLYNLFFNDQKANLESVHERLRRYVKEESLLVDTVPGYPQFLVFRRPIDMYVNEFSKNGLQLIHMQEVPIAIELQDNPKYSNRIGVPVFVYFIVRNTGTGQPF